MLKKILVSLLVAPAVFAAQVTIEAGQGFVPNRLTVKAGEEIVFTNNTSLNHTVTGDPTRAKNPANVILPAGAQTFHSGKIADGESFRLTLTVPGVYQYVCLPHEAMGMIGQIEVVAAEEIDE